jgi:hypothetical protein
MYIYIYIYVGSTVTHYIRIYIDDVYLNKNSNMWVLKSTYIRNQLEQHKYKMKSIRKINT